MNFVILGLLVLLVIGFFVVVWKAAQDWRWFNIVAVCFTMLLTVAFIFPTAGVLKSRAAWHQLNEQLEIKLAEVRVERDVLKYGDPNNPESGEGVVSLSQKLAKIGVEAGRRWRSLRMTNVANNNITLARVTDPGIAGVDPPAADAEAEAPAALIDDGLVVYGFAEAQDAQQQLIPVFYLGEFRVTASTPTQVTITPTGPLEPGQLQKITGRQATSWSLYELLPLDGHQMFFAEGSQGGEDNFFGRVDDELVKRLLGNKVTPETLQSYLRDGSRATAEDPPLSRWVKIEFEKLYSLDVDSPEQRGALDGGFFDGNGRSVDGRLQRGEDVKFRKGDQVLVKEEAANELINEGVAKLIDRYFLRPLNDYRFVLRRIRLRLTELEVLTKELDKENKVLTESFVLTGEMLVKNREIQGKLEADRAQFRLEKAAIQEYEAEIRATVEKMKKEMVRLHNENIELGRKIELYHKSIDQRTGSASTPVSRIR
ncbi:MAG: hypothetical protein AB8B91_08955 [Rubripirellula sp.]